MVELFGIFLLKKLTGKSKTDIENILDKYNSLPQLKNIIIIYDYIFLGFSRLVASSIIPKTIIISFGWIKKVIESDDTTTENAFLITLGHELTHKKEEVSKRYFLKKMDRKFINWVNEVHADFGAAKEMVNGSRDLLIKSTEYKLALKPYNKDSYSHPSWTRRLEYATNYNFDELLIRKIANDTSFENELLLKKVLKHFSPIILN